MSSSLRAIALIMVLALCACATNAMKPRGVVPLPNSKNAPKAPASRTQTGISVAAAAKPPRIGLSPVPALTALPAEKTPPSPVSERTSVLPDFVERRILTFTSSVEGKQRAAEAFVADVRAIPVRISSKVNETIEQATNVVQMPSRVVRRTQERAKEVAAAVEKLKAGQFGAALGLIVDTKNTDPYITRPGGGTDEKAKAKGKATGKQVQTGTNPLEVFEGVKESLYLLGDGVEGTGKAIVAVGEGIFSVVKAAGELPQTVERTSTSAARNLDAVVADIEGAKARASATGEQIVRIVTLEDARERVAGAKASLEDTQRKIKGAVDTITDLSEKIQGRKPFFPPPPPKPKPKSTYQTVFSAALKTAGGVASGVSSGVRWLLAKKEMEKEEPTPAAPPMNSPVSPVISAVAPTPVPGPVALAVPEAPRPASQEVIVQMPSGKLSETPTRRSFSPYKSVKEQSLKDP